MIVALSASSDIGRTGARPYAMLTQKKPTCIRLQPDGSAGNHVKHSRLDYTGSKRVIALVRNTNNELRECVTVEVAGCQRFPKMRSSTR
jgi:hypothetical protein